MGFVPPLGEGLRRPVPISCLIGHFPTWRLVSPDGSGEASYTLAMELTVRRTFRPRTVVAAVLALIGASLTVIGGTPAAATVVKPFTVAFNAQIHGGVVFAQNSALTCNGVRNNGSIDDADCAAVQAGAGRYRNNNNWRLVHIDVDDDPATFGSSRAPLRLPDDVEVVWAALYWGAGLQSNSGFSSPSADSINTIKLAAPGDTDYMTLTADADDVVMAGSVYQASTVVTDLVKAGGAGDYTVADLPAAQGADTFAGWTLAVVYEDPSRPLRDITIFDGYANIYRETVTMELSGLRAPVEGAVDATVGIVAYEGDDAAIGDHATLNGVRLSTAKSSGTNFFNSRIDTFGSLVEGATPSYANNLGFDVKVADATGVIPNSATSASVTIGSTGDKILLGLVSTRIDLTAPRFPEILSVANLTGHDPSESGDVLRYTLKLVNVGDDPADMVVISDVIPEGTTYVPGSLTVDGVTMTDGAGDDRGEVVTADGLTSVTARLGDGADATAGGRLAIGGEALVTFDVTVTGEPGSTVTNAGRLTYRAATLDRDVATATNTVTTPIAEDDEEPTPGGEPGLTVDALAPERVPAGDPVIYTVKVRSSGAVDATGVVLTDPVPEGVTISDVDDDCVLADGVITCTIGVLAPGAAWVGEFVGTVGADLIGESRITNEVTATADGEVTAADSVSTIVVGSVELSVAVEPLDPDVVSGEGDITLTVSNDTDLDATDVDVGVTLPDGLDLRDAETESCVADRSEVVVTVSCAVDVVPARSSVEVTVPVIVIGGDVVESDTEVVVGVAGTSNDLNPENDVVTINVAQQPAPVTLPATGTTGFMRWFGFGLIMLGIVLAGSSRRRSMSSGA